jgi:hypothetical protein
MFLEGTKEVEDVHDNRTLSQQVKHIVVDEAMNKDHLVKDDICLSLKVRLPEDMKGESTSNSTLEEKF